MRVTLIGGGTMGGAFLRSVTGKEVIDPQNILVIERDQQRCAALSAEYRCYVSSALTPQVSASAVIVLAVKPQDFEALGAALSPLLRPEQTVLSFMGGVSLESLATALGKHGAVVRAMPNLPFLIGQGMTVYIPSLHCPPERLSGVLTLLGACGESMAVVDERLMDAATAVSGTGPGYVYYFLEHFVRAAEELGFTSAQAELLVASTITGSMNVWLQGEATPQELRAAVTSPNGTTAAAVKVFDDAGWGEVFRSAIARACARSRELGGR